MQPQAAPPSTATPMLPLWRIAGIGTVFAALGPAVGSLAGWGLLVALDPSPGPYPRPLLTSMLWAGYLAGGLPLALTGLFAAGFAPWVRRGEWPAAAASLAALLGLILPAWVAAAGSAERLEAVGLLTGVLLPSLGVGAFAAALAAGPLRGRAAGAAAPARVRLLAVAVVLLVLAPAAILIGARAWTAYTIHRFGKLQVTAAEALPPVQERGLAPGRQRLAWRLRLAPGQAARLLAAGDDVSARMRTCHFDDDLRRRATIEADPADPDAVRISAVFHDLERRWGGCPTITYKGHDVGGRLRLQAFPD